LQGGEAGAGIGCGGGGKVFCIAILSKNIRAKKMPAQERAKSKTRDVLKETVP
jgi:hypothetical protein